MPEPGPHWTAWGTSVINALVGDELSRRGNRLALEMSLYHRGRPLPLDAAHLHVAHPRTPPRLCVLVHGLGCHEGVWTFPHVLGQPHGRSYGALLEEDLGYAPLYVRYNTGLAVTQSGAALARLVAALVAAYPVPVEELVLIGHSMGGLVIRSACDIAAGSGAPWPALVRRVFYLGTPHEGADLARLGHMAETVLDAVPTPITRLVAGVLRLRSQGIRDLHQGAGPGAAPWLPSARHYLLAGALGGHAGHPLSLLAGDGLVRVPSGHGAGPVLLLPPEQVRVFPLTHHMQLAHDHAVYQQIKDWCADV